MVLETLKERLSVADLTQNYEIAPQQIHLWKREFPNGVESVFESKIRSRKSQADEEKDELLKSIEPLKVENYFLNKILR